MAITSNRDLTPRSFVRKLGVGSNASTRAEIVVRPASDHSVGSVWQILVEELEPLSFSEWRLQNIAVVAGKCKRCAWSVVSMAAVAGSLCAASCL